MFNPKTVQSSLKLLFYFTKILGLSPFKIEEDCFKTSWPYVIWSLVLMIFIGSYSLYAVNYKQQINSTIITKVTDRIHIHLCILSVCVGIFFGCIHGRDIITVINDISRIDKKLKHLKLDIELHKAYRQTAMYLIVSMVVVLICLSSLAAFDVAIFADTVDFIRIGELIAYNSPIVAVFIEFQFCTLALLLKERFSWLNSKMLEIDHGFQNKRMSINYKDSLQNITLAVLEKISMTHYELCNISKKLNKAYSCQLLVIIMQSFMTIVAMSFYLAKYIFSNEEVGSGLDYRIYFGPALAVFFVSMVTLTNVCSRTTKEARKTGILLHHIISLFLCTNNEGYVDLGVICFSLQLIHQNVNFNACKLFVIDETLLTSIVGAAATYLIIVLQFEIGVTKSNQQSMGFNNFSFLRH